MHLLLLLLLACAPACQAQQVTQFLPSGPAAVAEGVTARLVYRQNGFAQNWKDPTVGAVYLAGDVTLEPEFWRSQFSESNGVARVGPKAATQNFTVTSGNSTSEDTRPALSFSGMDSAVLVESGGYLLFNNVYITDINLSGYTFNPSQPYINRGIGYGLWPTIALAPNALLYLINVTASYVNPSPLDTCEQYTNKYVFGLRQAYGAENVSLVNGSNGRLSGPVHVTVLVLNATTNATVGNATAIFENVTFKCLPQQNATAAAASGLAPGALVAAIAVPVAVVLAALLPACCCIRRRNLRRRKAAAAAEAPEGSKDLEAGDFMEPAYSQDLCMGRDQLGRGSRGGRRSNNSQASSAGHAPSTSTIRNFLAIPPETPIMDGILGTRNSIHSTGGSSGNSNRMRAAGAAGSSGASILTPVGSMPLGVIPSSSHNNSNDSGGRWRSSGPSTQSSAMQRLSIEAGFPAASASSAAGTESSSLGPLVHTGGTHSGSGTSSGQLAGGAGSSGGRQTVAERYAGITSLLKARSDIAVLRELKIGPLLGRGSYGRVYRGRWKATTVAVKIIEHVEGAPGTASSGGKRISVGRESLLASTISHPNVVQTYHISTMTVAQRSALANTWLTDTSATGAKGSPDQTQQEQEQAQDDASSDDNNSHGSVEAQQRDQLLETWLILEFCEKGSLERAVNQGRFIRRADKLPEMVGIYKALLDTASGLDYLHSMGIVHGDLKTANVLLKGSAKDARGFMCKITDFGLSRVLDLDATHISTATYGTIVYMPKELLLSGRMTQATDIYSFGLMMWELYTSSRVFDEGLSIGQMFYMIAYQTWRPHIPDGCPPGFVELMTACWDDDPEQRPKAQDLLKRLQRLYANAKQELAAAKEAEAAVAGAAAAAAAAVAAGGPSSADSEGSAGQTAAAAAAAAGSGSGGEEVGAGRSKQQQKKQKGPSRAAAGVSPFAGSGSSVADSIVGPLGSGGPVTHSGGLNLGSGLTVSGGGSSSPKGVGSADGVEDVDGYKPYAAAVLQRKRSGSLATGSITSGAYTSAHRSSAGHRQLQQQLQQQQQRQQSGASSSHVTFASAAGGPAVSSPREMGSARVAIGSGSTLPGSSEIEVFDDPIPSEALLQPFTSDSNIMDGGNDTAEEDNTYSGYFAEIAEGEEAAQGSAAAARGGAGRPAVGSLEMSSRPQGQCGPTWGADSSRWGRVPPGFGTPPYPSGGASTAAGQAGGPPDLGRGDSCFQDSFSTGTMPSVIGDNASWLGSQSSRSFAGSTQPSGRFSSSMNLGSMPPHSPTYGSGAGMGSGDGFHAGPGAFAEAHGAAGAQQQPAQASAFQAAAGSGIMPPASPASRSYGALQTVHEGSGPLEGSGITPQASPDVTVADARVVSTAAAPAAAPQAAAQRPALAPVPAQPPAGPAAAAAAAAPAASPFAALAQRAGSLFGPLEP